MQIHPLLLMCMKHGSYTFSPFSEKSVPQQGYQGGPSMVPYIPVNMEWGIEVCSPRPPRHTLYVTSDASGVVVGQYLDTCGYSCHGQATGRKPP